MDSADTVHPILNLPLSQIMRPDVALSLQHLLKIHTVGGLLEAWKTPRNQRSIEQVFESPQQARHAIATCFTWLGMQSPAGPQEAAGWWGMEA